MSWFKDRVNAVTNWASDTLDHATNVALDFLDHAGNVINSTLDRWLGGGDKTSVATSVSRVIEDKYILSSVDTGVTVALLSDNSIVDQVLEHMVHGMGMRAERMHSYAKLHYVYGMPGGVTMAPMDSKPLAISLLAAEIGAAVDPLNFNIGPPNLLHVGWGVLVDSHGYNSLTNQLEVLSASLGTPVYLQDMVLITGSISTGRASQSSLMVRGVGANAGYTPYRAALPGIRQATSSQSDMGTVYDRLRVDYVYTQTVSAVVEGFTIQQEQRVDASFDISLASYDIAASYYQVAYLDGVGKRKYWIYKIGSGTYPALDSSYDAQYDPLGNFFPFTYLRFNGLPPSTDHGSEEYTTTRKLLKYIGMDYDTTVTGVNSNPEIASVTSALMVFAVPAVTTNPIEQRYLFDFFEQVYFEALAKEPTKLTHSATFGIADKRYRMALDIPKITRVRKGGVLGPVGTTTSDTSDYILSPGESYVADITGVYTSGTITYRKQVSSGYYDEVAVSLMTLNYTVIDSYSTIADYTSPNLLIPIDRNISKEYSLIDKEVLYARSLHYVINAVSVQHIAWYQTPAFSAILLIAAVVVSVISLGSSITAYQALGLGLLSAATLALAVFIINGLIVSYAISLFVKAIGKDLAIRLAAVLAIVAAYKSINGSSTLTYLPSSKDLLWLSSSMAKGVGDAAARDFDSFRREQDDYLSSVDSRNKDLERTKALLENSTVMSPFVIFGEKPDEYFNRTVHAGNIGVTGIDMVTMYVDVALTLPRLAETT